MRAPDWLTARPIAHRGLHDRARGIIENMPAAAQAAVSGKFGIECDIQLTADGEAMVHHDDALGRLTEGSGALLGMTSAQLRAVKFKDTSECMMSLGDLCALVDGRVPLVIEVKSHFDGDRKLVSADVGGARFLFGTCGRDVVRPGSGAGVARKDAGRFLAGSLPNAPMTKRTGRRRRSLSAKACCTSGMRSVPSRISWRIGSTIYRPRRPGSPATSSACRC